MLIITDAEKSIKIVHYTSKEVAKIHREYLQSTLIKLKDC